MPYASNVPPDTLNLISTRKSWLTVRAVPLRVNEIALFETDTPDDMPDIEVPLAFLTVTVGLEAVPQDAGIVNTQGAVSSIPISTGDWSITRLLIGFPGLFSNVSWNDLGGRVRLNVLSNVKVKLKFLSGNDNNRAVSRIRKSLSPMSSKSSSLPTAKNIVITPS